MMNASIRILLFILSWFNLLLRIECFSGLSSCVGPSTLGVSLFPAYGRRKKRYNSGILLSTAEDVGQELVSSSSSSKEEIESGLNYFQTLAGNIVNCIIKSDLKRKGGGDGGSTGWTSWVDDKSSYALKSCIDLLSMSIPENPTGVDDFNDKSKLFDRDEAMGWVRWLKSSPKPMVIEMSNELRHVANEFILDKDLENIESTREELLDRIGLRLITLPSGMSLNQPIRTAPGAMAFGKLLWGGAKRFRLLPGKLKRRTGERVAMKTSSNIMEENIPCWMQYGGPERNYEAIDMGPCCILEIIVLPKGVKFLNAMEEGDGMESTMTMDGLNWDPNKMFDFYDESNYSRLSDKEVEDNPSTDSDIDELITLSGKERNEFLERSFTETVGGLQPQIEQIVRRVLDGRVYRSYDGNEEDNEIVGMQSLLDAKELEILGLQPVRGLLLYGPPGCGKTALAREIARSLRAREPKVVAAPELLDSWVGGSEKLVRSLFVDAERELSECSGDATKSSLHVIVIDEIDSVFRKRSKSTDSASTTRASAVNQILAKLDGVNTLSNVLVIGMTNRRDLLDEALLRSGRLEVQVEIPLPTQEGRREILQIHFEALRRNGRLSEPLCRAIDGPRTRLDGYGANELTRTSRNSFRQIIRKAPKLHLPTEIDLSADKWTKGFSGADIEGLVRCSGSIALARAREQDIGVEGLLITLEDVKQALNEIQR